jgi:hypothetical protein
MVPVLLLAALAACASASRHHHRAHPKPALRATAGPPVSIAPSDPNIYYSPYAWALNGTAATATTLNTNSYFRTLFTGSSVTLTFDVSNMVNPPSQLYYEVDNGPRTPFLVCPNLTIAVPVNLTHGDVPYHYLRVSVKSMTERAARWAATGPTTRVVFTGLQLEAGAVLGPTVASNMNILMCVVQGSLPSLPAAPSAGPPAG